MSALIGELSITASDGTVLTAQTDVALAWQWAELEVTASPDYGDWEALSYGERCAHVGEALRELRRAFTAAQ